MERKEKFYEDILPEIETHVHEETTSFTSGDIAEDLDGYTPQEVGRTLRKLVLGKEDSTDHVILTGNNPKTWEAVLLDGTAWERIEYELDVEPQKKEPNKIAEEVMDENPETEEEDLYSSFINRLEENDLYKNTAESIRKMRQTAERKKPEIDSNIKNLSAQEYGRLRSSIDEVHGALEEVKEERDNYFQTSNLKDKVKEIGAQEIGFALTAMATAGLIEQYSDRELYDPDSINLEEIREFRRAAKHAESIENLQDFLELTENK